jgi:carboxymethylenebutenolidase
LFIHLNAVYLLFFCFSLYRGKVGLDVAEAQHLMDGLDWQGAVKDIRASANWLKANGSKKVWLFVYLLD